MTVPSLFKEYIWLVNTIKRARLTSSLKKHVFYNFLINNIMYLCVI